MIKIKTESKMGTFKTFEVGNIYEMRFIGDSQLRPEFICVKRTEKTATFERFKETEQFSRRIKLNDEGVEYVAYGSYSMAPTIYANKVVG